MDPEGTLRRRDFLRRTAYTAGMAGAAMLPANALLAQAAKATGLRSGLPSSPGGPIDHIVILMMENRSFDHYFGWYSSLADAVQNRSYPDPQNNNQLVPTHHAADMGVAQWQGCGHPDPDHSWDGGRAQLGSALNNTSVELDGFLEGSNDEFALSYYNGRTKFPVPIAAHIELKTAVEPVKWTPASSGDASAGSPISEPEP